MSTLTAQSSADEVSFHKTIGGFLSIKPELATLLVFILHLEHCMCCRKIGYIYRQTLMSAFKIKMRVLEADPMICTCFSEFANHFNIFNCLCGSTVF